jgi:indole-3-glycerol phosphate synthase
VTDARRLSLAISEGDGISVIVQVERVDDAAAAEAQGAEGIALRRAIEGVSAATTLPVLWLGGHDDHAARSCNAHAVIVSAEVGDERLRELHESFGEELELVVSASNEDELALAVELDAQIFLLAADEAEGDQHAVDRVIELLPDVPAGKLAIAEVDAASRDEVVALEAAGFDAVLVPPGHVGELVGGTPPEV